MNKPSCKFFASQISNCTLKEVHQGRVWTCSHGSKTFEFTHVWLQGLIVYVDISADKIVLDDGTGTVMGIGLKRLPFVFLSEYKKGDYIMIAGRLMKVEKNSIGQFVPIILVLKTSRFDGHLDAETLWYLEVIDLQTSS